MTTMRDDVVAAAARAAARELVPQYGARLEAEVEAELYRAGESGPPSQFFDPVAIGGLIVAIATLAYQIYSDRKKDGEKPSKEALGRTTRVEWRKEHDLTPAGEKIIETVSVEITTRGAADLRYRQPSGRIWELNDCQRSHSVSRRTARAGLIYRAGRPGRRG